MPAGKTSKAERAERLAAALRANLRRRKAQLRGRREDCENTPADSHVDGHEEIEKPA